MPSNIVDDVLSADGPLGPHPAPTAARPDANARAPMAVALLIDTPSESSAGRRWFREIPTGTDPGDRTAGAGNQIALGDDRVPTTAER